MQQASNFMLNKQEWATIENLVQLLKPFELITNVLSSEVQPLISMVMTILQSLLQNFICEELEEESELITKMKFILQHQLKSRFSTILDDKCHTGETRIDILDISTFLDPRFKNKEKFIGSIIKTKNFLNNIVKNEFILFSDEEPLKNSSKVDAYVVENVIPKTECL